MTQIITGFLGLIQDLFMFFIPEFSLAPQLVANFDSVVSTVFDFVIKVNFLIPLSDIIYIISFDIGIRIFKVVIFGGNWIIRRIFDVIP
jgi:hypothetical protein